MSSLRSLFFLLYICTFLLRGVPNVEGFPDLSTEKFPDPAIGLQMKLQFDLAQDLGGQGRRPNFVYSTHMKFRTSLADPGAGDPVLSDEQMHQMGCDAWEEMKANRAQYGMGAGANKAHRPTGMIAVLVVDKEIFISRTIKGPSFIYDLNVESQTDINKSLKLCQATMYEYFNPEGGDTTIHNNEAGCAEPMAVAQYYVLHPDRLLRDATNTRILPLFMSWKRMKVNGEWTEEWGECLITPPCGEYRNAKWGCDIFVEKNNARPLPEGLGKASYDLTGLGMIGVPDQAKLCR